MLAFVPGEGWAGEACSVVHGEPFSSLQPPRGLREQHCVPPSPHTPQQMVLATRSPDPSRLPLFPVGFHPRQEPLPKQIKCGPRLRGTCSRLCAQLGLPGTEYQPGPYCGTPPRTPITLGLLLGPFGPCMLQTRESSTLWWLFGGRSLPGSRAKKACLIFQGPSGVVLKTDGAGAEVTAAKQAGGDEGAGPRGGSGGWRGEVASRVVWRLGGIC